MSIYAKSLDFSIPVTRSRHPAGTVILELPTTSLAAQTSRTPPPDRRNSCSPWPSCTVNTPRLICPLAVSECDHRSYTDDGRSAFFFIITSALRTTAPQYPSRQLDPPPGPLRACCNIYRRHLERLGPAPQFNPLGLAF